MDPWARWYRVHGVKQSKRWHLFFFFFLCVRPRLRLTMEMDGGGEIERN
jgi:hypothetical protein